MGDTLFQRVYSMRNTLLRQRFPRRNPDGVGPLGPSLPRVALTERGNPGLDEPIPLGLKRRWHRSLEGTWEQPGVYASGAPSHIAGVDPLVTSFQDRLAQAPPVHHGREPLRSWRAGVRIELGLPRWIGEP